MEALLVTPGAIEHIAKALFFEWKPIALCVSYIGVVYECMYVCMSVCVYILLCYFVYATSIYICILAVM